MSPDQRNYISMARSEHYFNVMRTTLFAFIGLAAIIHLGPDDYSAPLAMLVVATTAYGVLAGSTALVDITSLRADMDEETARSHYGRTLRLRNFKLLNILSATLLALIGIAELLAILT